MNQNEYEGIKRRHAAGGYIEPDITTSETGNKTYSFVTGDMDVANFYDMAYVDVKNLIKEHDRFRANYERGLAILDNLMLMHGNTLPRRIADDAKRAQAEMRGLL